MLADLNNLKKSYSVYVIDNVSSCFTKLTGAPSAFVNGQGFVTTADAIDEAEANNRKIKEEEENNRLAKAQQEAEIDKMVEEAILNRRNLKCQTLSLLDTANQMISEQEALSANLRKNAFEATIKECAIWAKEDRRAAITNSVCNQIFREIGLPEDNENEDALEKTINGLSAKSQKLSYEAILRGIKRTERLVSLKSERQLVIEQLQKRQNKDKPETAEKIDTCDIRWQIWEAQN